jgi:hypothetical protein
LTFRYRTKDYLVFGESKKKSQQLSLTPKVRDLVIKDQLRHTNVKTTVDFYIGADVDYQREMIEKLVINSGKIVGNGEISQPTQLPTA